MDVILYDSLKAHARDLGFDSAQAYIRFWASSEVQNNATTAKSQALRYLELVLLRHQKDFTSPEQVLDYICHHIRATGLHKLLKERGMSLRQHTHPDKQ